jgi:hypothetical protein
LAEKAITFKNTQLSSCAVAVYEIFLVFATTLFAAHSIVPALTIANKAVQNTVLVEVSNRYAT